MGFHGTAITSSDESMILVAMTQKSTPLNNQTDHKPLLLEETAYRVEVSIEFLPNAWPDTKIEIVVLSGDTPVAQKTVSRDANEVVTETFEFDTITGVRLESSSAEPTEVMARLTKVKFKPVSQSANSGWQYVPTFRYPLCLPAAHDNYPCPGAPSDPTAAREMALERICPKEWWRGEWWWDDSSFDILHNDLLLELVKGGPDGGMMAGRRRVGVKAVQDPNIQMPEQYPLDLILMGALRPDVAQVLGLYWVDTSADQDGKPYDYLILADDKNLFNGNPDKALEYIRKNGFSDVNAYIVFNKKVEQSPSLAPPADMYVYALPGGYIPNDNNTLRNASNVVGLRWQRDVLDVGKRVLLPDRAIMYHLWRVDLGDDRPGASVKPPIENYRCINDHRPISVANPDLPPGTTPQRPPNWPPFPLDAIDSGLADGWYSYRISGVDIFGRHSPLSEPGTWHQYYAVQVLDKIPPPPPAAIEAYALDPVDPSVVKDAAYCAWFDFLTKSQWYQALLPVEQRNLIGLRVRWQWSEAHMRQAPDVREFRVYY